MEKMSKMIFRIIGVIFLIFFFSLGTIFAQALEGDANNDGKVDGVDYVVWLNNFGRSTSNGFSEGDLNISGRVDGVDYVIWLSNYGRTLASTPTSNTSKTIMAAGDIACGPLTVSTAQCKEWETSELIRRVNPDAVLALGDIQYESGKLEDFLGNPTFCKSNPARCFNGTWGRFKNIIYPAIGNHEYGTSGAKGYFDYFNGVGVQIGRVGDRSKGYYSFDIGSWHLIALNSNCAKIGGCNPGSPQERWLRADLAAHQNKCTLAFWHHPLFSSGHHGNEVVRFDYKPLWQALMDFKAELVLVGHSHDYERLAPMNADGVKDTVNGMRSFVVGTGGRDFTGFLSTINPNSEKRNNRTFGLLKLTLNPESYEWNFVPIAGQTFTDTGVAFCH